MASAPTPPLRLWATAPGATPARLTEHTTGGSADRLEPELSTLLETGTFYFALTLRLHMRYGLQGCSPTFRGLYREASPWAVSHLGRSQAIKSYQQLLVWVLLPLVIQALEANRTGPHARGGGGAAAAPNSPWIKSKRPNSSIENKGFTCLEMHREGLYPRAAKVDGNNISFTVKIDYNGQTMVTRYEGTLSGDELKVTRDTPNGPMTSEMTAKRSAT